MEDAAPLIALGITFVAVYAAQALALRKKRSRMGWMWAAALLGPIPLLILVFLPAKAPFRADPRISE
jgi:hypothetical protein